MKSYTGFVLMIFLLAETYARIYVEQNPVPYKFSYGVDDPHTGDHHEHQEISDGHIVKGSYSLKDADGTTRIVKYKASPQIGFHANVERIGHAYHPDHRKSIIKQINGYDIDNNIYGEESFKENYRNSGSLGEGLWRHVY